MKKKLFDELMESANQALEKTKELKKSGEMKKIKERKNGAK